MTTLTLNIYKNQKEIEKTLTADGYDLMYGTCEELLNLFDADKMTDDKSVALMVIKCFDQLKPLLKDIFPDVTDEDLKHIKIKELIPLFVTVCKIVIDDMGLLKSGN